MAKSVLQNQETFPYDCLDQIFAYAVDAGDKKPTKQGTKAALRFGLVCRFWQERFLGGDVMWGVILSQSGLAHATSWRTHKWTNRAFEMAKELFPIASHQLTPLEDCSLEFQCPVYAEALTYKGNKKFHCSGCNKSVFLVTSMAEKDQRAKEGHCVMMTLSGPDGLSAPSEGNGRYFPLLSDEDPDDLIKIAERERNSSSGGPPILGVCKTTIRIAVITKSNDLLHTTVRHFLRQLAAEAGADAVVKAKDGEILAGAFGLTDNGPVPPKTTADAFRPTSKRSVAIFPMLTMEYGKMRYFFKAMLDTEAREHDNLTCDALSRFSGTILIGQPGKGDSNLSGNNNTAFRASGPLFHLSQDQGVLGSAALKALDEHFNPQIAIPMPMIMGVPPMPPMRPMPPKFDKK